MTEKEIKTLVEKFDEVAMLLGPLIIRSATASAVLRVAAVAAVASYEHAYELVRAHGETGWTVCLIWLTVDGLIYAISLVVLDSASRRQKSPHRRGGSSA